MSLHKTIEIARKIIFYVGGGLGAFIIIFIIFQIGAFIKYAIFPPDVTPPTASYDKLQAMQFPANATDKPLTFTINTLSGFLPEFPDRLAVFPLEEPQPSLLNLDKAKEKVRELKFVNSEAILLPETRVGATTYRWSERTGLKRSLNFDILSFNFNLTADLMTLQLSSSSANRITPTEAVNKVTSLLSQIKLTPSDLDATKTTNPPEELKRITKPQLFALKNGTLQPVTLLTETQVIRIDLYQADITYDLDTGVAGSDGEIQKEEITLPIVYPQPPYSTMNFLVSTYNANPEIVGANFAYQKPLIDDANQATYPIKTAEEAFEELQQGKGYVAAYFGTENNIAITDAYLAYYLGDLTQKYIMPVIVFEGNNGFFGYISAIRDDWITTTASQE